MPRTSFITLVKLAAAIPRQNQNFFRRSLISGHECSTQAELVDVETHLKWLSHGNRSRYARAALLVRLKLTRSPPHSRALSGLVWVSLDFSHTTTVASRCVSLLSVSLSCLSLIYSRPIAGVAGCYDCLRFTLSSCSDTDDL